MYLILFLSFLPKIFVPEFFKISNWLSVGPLHRPNPAEFTSDQNPIESDQVQPNPTKSDRIRPSPTESDQI